MVRRSFSILRPRKYIVSLHHKFVNVWSVEALIPARKSSLSSALSESTEIAPSPTLSAIFNSRPALFSYCCGCDCTLNLRCAAPVSISVRDCTASSNFLGQAVLSQRFPTMAESRTDMSQVTLDTSTHQKVDMSSSRANEVVDNATAKDSQASHAPRFAIFTAGIHWCYQVPICDYYRFLVFVPAVTSDTMARFLFTSKDVPKFQYENSSYESHALRSENIQIYSSTSTFELVNSVESHGSLSWPC